MAEQATHTPGPWYCQYPRDNTPPDRGYAVLGGGISGSSEEGIVAYCQRWISKPCPADEANARLISAAPELLAELIHANEFIDKHAFSERLADGAGMVRRHRAIAKATGQK